MTESTSKAKRATDCEAIVGIIRTYSDFHCGSMSEPVRLNSLMYTHGSENEFRQMIGAVEDHFGISVPIPKDRDIGEMTAKEFVSWVLEELKEKKEHTAAKEDYKDHLVTAGSVIVTEKERFAVIYCGNWDTPERIMVVNLTAGKIAAWFWENPAMYLSYSQIAKKLGIEIVSVESGPNGMRL